MSIEVRHRIDRMARDYRHVPAEAKRGFMKAVRSNALDGRDLARTLARESAGKHGKHYPKSITAEVHRGNPLSWEYGPDSALPQGDMSFEFGSRNQKPHLDLARSADKLTGPLLADVRFVLARLPW